MLPRAQTQLPCAHLHQGTPPGSLCSKDRAFPEVVFRTAMSLSRRLSAHWREGRLWKDWATERTNRSLLTSFLEWILKACLSDDLPATCMLDPCFAVSANSTMSFISAIWDTDSKWLTRTVAKIRGSTASHFTRYFFLGDPTLFSLAVGNPLGGSQCILKCSNNSPDPSRYISDHRLEYEDWRTARGQRKMEAFVLGNYALVFLSFSCG